MKSKKPSKYALSIDNLQEIVKNMENDYQGIINLILDKLVETINSETGTFWYLSEDGFIYAESVYMNQKLSRVMLLPGEGIAGSVIKRKKETIVDDCKLSKNWYRKADYFNGFSTKSILCVPFIINGKCKGCFQFINRKGNALFDKQDMFVVKEMVAFVSNIFESNIDDAFKVMENMINKDYRSNKNLLINDDVKLVIKAFGNFEVFSVGSPLKFKYDKAKELLALLVDKRGALLSNEEILATLWEDDKNHDSYLRNIKTDLINTLKKVNADEIVVKQKGKIGILPNMLKCDYYEYLNGEENALSAYSGEYMYQYSWAESTNANLDYLKFQK